MRTARANVALFVAALLVRLFLIGRENFWIDEVNTVTSCEGSPAHVLERMRLRNETHPPLYYFLLSAWMRVAGDGDGATRSLSAIFGALAVPVAAAIAREVMPGAELPAAILATLSPGMIQYSQETRMYALLTFLAGCVLLLWIRGAPTSREKVALAVATTLMLLTHHVGLFFGAALGVLGLAIPGKRLARSVALVAGLLLYSPWLFVVARQWSTTRRAFTWNVVGSPLVELLRVVPYAALGDAPARTPAGRVAQAAVVLGSLVGLLLLARSSRAKAALLAGALAIPPLMVLLFSALPFGASLLHRRFFCFLAVGLVTLPAVASGRAPRRILGMALLGILAASFLVLDVARLVRRDHIDMRGIVALLDDELQSGDPVLHASVEGLCQESFLLARHYRPGFRHAMVARDGRAFSMETAGYVGEATVYPDLATALEHEGRGRRQVAVISSGMAAPRRGVANEMPVAPIPRGWRIAKQRSFHLADVLFLERRSFEPASPPIE